MSWSPERSTGLICDFFARETCCQLPALPAPFGCCWAAPWLVRLLLCLCCGHPWPLAFVLFQHLASPVKKTAAGRAGKLKVLVIYLLGKTDAGHARCSEIIIFMTVGSRGSCHFGSFLCEALPVESVRESHKIALSREPMWMLGVWRRKQGRDLLVLQRKWNFLWKRKK